MNLEGIFKIFIQPANISLLLIYFEEVLYEISGKDDNDETIFKYATHISNF